MLEIKDKLQILKQTKESRKEFVSRMGASNEMNAS